MVGLYTDRYPKPYSLAIGMGFTLVGLLLLSVAASFPMILIAAGLVGMGSSVFHPESSRMARRGGTAGLAQSLFQVGGNAGSAIGPLLAAFIVVPQGQASIAWFSIAAILAISVLFQVGAGIAGRSEGGGAFTHGAGAGDARPALSRARITFSVGILMCLVFSKYIYLVSLSNYYTFYLIDKFAVSVQAAQVYLFVFLGPSRWGPSPAGRSATASATSSSSGALSWGCCRSP